jgi:uncharacterized protein (TIGR02757 family)
MNLQARLDAEVLSRDRLGELSYDRPDPLLVAKRYGDEYIALFCALFSYGSAVAIVKFLDSIDFSLIDSSEDRIRQALKRYYYRFQSEDDIVEFMVTLKRLKDQGSLEDIFCTGYLKKKNVITGIYALIETMRTVNHYDSRGYRFLIGTVGKHSPYKRYNMFLRWMVRHDALDMGLWTKVDKRDLLLPLDTHTFNVSKRLGLCGRKTYDLKAAIMITEKLREFDANDPVKYDFALYRLGQEKQC